MLKVRRQFMRHLRIWICDLDDKYDHHGKLVPYLLTGLFDEDEVVRDTSLGCIDTIGKQIEVEKEKQFRQFKQFAIYPAWTWDGQLVDLFLPSPLTARPSLGSRFFIRGHVRKFWTALYKEIKDINIDNRIRSCNLALYGCVYTENYLTQYLDNMIPQLITSIISPQKEDAVVCGKIQLIMHYIGRYCPQSAYLHIMRSALKGQLVQNQQFLRNSLIGLAKLISGNLEAIPSTTGLQHKKNQMMELLQLLAECEIQAQVYKYNCKEARQIVSQIINGLQNKAKSQQIQQIMGQYGLLMFKVVAVTHYQQAFAYCYTLQHYQLTLQSSEQFQNLLDKIWSMWRGFDEQLQEYLSEQYQDPPSLMQTNWKILTALYHYLLFSQQKTPHILYVLTQDVIYESLWSNRSIQILSFVFKFCLYMFKHIPSFKNIVQMHTLTHKALKNLSQFKAKRKLPIYDEPFQPQHKSNIYEMMQQNYFTLFKYASEVVRAFSINKVQLAPPDLANIIIQYLNTYKKIYKNQGSTMEAVKTIWAVFQKTYINQQFAKNFYCKVSEGKQQPGIRFVIDFVIERLQTMMETDYKKMNMLFGILQNSLKAWPECRQELPVLTHVYPQYPELLQKMLKYAMDEKNLETKDKYYEFLTQVCKKISKWFIYEAQMAEKGKRFHKAKLVRELIHRAGIKQ